MLAQLCFHGALMFLLGLLNGGLVQLFENPRAALSAHLAAVQSGLALLVFAAVWKRVRLPENQARLAGVAMIVSLYAIWIALLLAAALGTSGATPIAGAGFAGSAVAEVVVSVLLYAGSAGSIVSAGLIAWGLRPSAATG